MNVLSKASLEGFINGAPLPIVYSGVGRHLRFWDVIVSKNGSSITFSNLSTRRANKIKNDLRRKRYRVDLIDIEAKELEFRSNLSKSLGNMETPIVDTSKEPGVVPEYISIKNKNWHQAKEKAVRWAQSHIDTRKAERQRIANERNQTFVYDKMSGELRFNGELEDGIQYIIDQMNAGIWGDKDWVVYIPVKLYNEIMKEGE